MAYSDSIDPRNLGQLYQLKANEAQVSEEDARAYQIAQMLTMICSSIQPDTFYLTGNYVSPNTQSSVANQTQLVFREIFLNVAAGTDGAIVYRPFDGCDGINRLSPLLPGNYVPSQGSAATSSWPLGLVGLSMRVANQVWVPCVAQADVTIKPALATSAVIGRTVAACVQIFSDATSTTRAAMSGTLNAAALGDLRSVPSLQAADLKQNSVNKKDGLIAVPAQDGITFLQATDIRQNLGVVQTSAVINTGDSGLASDVLQGTVLSGSFITQDQPYAQRSPTQGYGAAYISYATILQAEPTSTTTPSINPPLNVAIPYAANDNIHLRLYAGVKLALPPSSSAPPPPGTILSGQVTVISYYVQANPAVLVPSTQLPTLTVYGIKETITVTDTLAPQPWASPSPPANGSIPIGMDNLLSSVPVTLSNGTTTSDYCYFRNQQIFYVKPAQPDPQHTVWIGAIVMTSNGLYGGTWQNPVSSTNPLPGVGGAAVTTGTVTGVLSGFTAYTTGTTTVTQTIVANACVTEVYQIDVIASDLYDRGLLGPARVVTWSNMAPGQNIIVRGCQLCEIVSTAQLTAYFQAAQKFTSLNTTGTAVLSQLYNSQLPQFSRCYIATRYEEYVKTFFPALQLESLTQMDPALKKLLDETGNFRAVERVRGAVVASAEFDQFEKAELEELKSEMRQLQRQIALIGPIRAPYRLPPTGIPAASEYFTRKRSRNFEAEGDMYDDGHEEDGYGTCHAAGGPGGIYGSGGDDGGVYAEGNAGGQYGSGGDSNTGVFSDGCVTEEDPIHEDALAAGNLFLPFQESRASVQSGAATVMSGPNLQTIDLWKYGQGTFSKGNSVDYTPVQYQGKTRTGEPKERTWTFPLPSNVLISAKDLMSLINYFTHQLAKIDEGKYNAFWQHVADKFIQGWKPGMPLGEVKKRILQSCSMKEKTGSRANDMRALISMCSAVHAVATQFSQKIPSIFAHVMPVPVIMHTELRVENEQHAGIRFLMDPMSTPAFMQSVKTNIEEAKYVRLKRSAHALAMNQNLTEKQTTKRARVLFEAMKEAIDAKRTNPMSWITRYQLAIAPKSPGGVDVRNACARNVALADAEPPFSMPPEGAIQAKFGTSNAPPAAALTEPIATASGPPAVPPTPVNLPKFVPFVPPVAGGKPGKVRTTKPYVSPSAMENYIDKPRRDLKTSYDAQARRAMEGEPQGTVDV